MNLSASRAALSTAAPPRWLWILYLALGAAFVAACGLAASRLTLFWDDYEFILMQIREPLSSIFMGSNSHDGPLSMVALRIVSQTFGLWYPGYVMTNAVLAVAATGMLMFAVWGRLVSKPWIVLVGSTVYLTSLGFVATLSIAICLEWFLALAFAAGSALAVSRGCHWAVWGGLLAASALSMSGNFPVNAAIVASVYLMRRWSGAVKDGTSLRGPLIVAVVLVLLGGLGGALGAVLTRLHPMDYYRPVTEASGAVPVPASISEALWTTVSLFTSWTASPLLVVALTSTTFILTLTIFVRDHLVLTTIGLLSVAIGVVLVARFMARTTSASRAIDRVLPLTMLAPVLVWAALLAVARGGSPFPVRYQMVWLLPVMVTYAMVIAAPSRSRVFRAVQWVAAVLVSCSAVVGVVRLPMTFHAGADADMPRWEMSAQQRERMLACADPDGALPTPVEEISPAFPAEDFCEVVNYLRTNSIAGRILGVSN